MLRSLIYLLTGLSVSHAGPADASPTEPPHHKVRYHSSHHPFDHAGR